MIMIIINIDHNNNDNVLPRQAAAAEQTDRGPTIPQPLRIVLDETVIPQKYARYKNLARCSQQLS